MLPTGLLLPLTGAFDSFVGLNYIDNIARCPDVDLAHCYEFCEYGASPMTRASVLECPESLLGS
jgi:hypothetical protein